MPGDKVRGALLRVARILVDPPPVAGMRLRLGASAGVLITSTLVSNVAVLFPGEYWGIGLLGSPKSSSVAASTNGK